MTLRFCLQWHLTYKSRTHCEKRRYWIWFAQSVKSNLSMLFQEVLRMGRLLNYRRRLHWRFCMITQVVPNAFPICRPSCCLEHLHSYSRPVLPVPSHRIMCKMVCIFHVSHFLQSSDGAFAQFLRLSSLRFHRLEYSSSRYFAYPSILTRMIWHFPKYLFPLIWMPSRMAGSSCVALIA